MAKKQLNVAAIQNELEGSAFFTGPRFADRHQPEPTPQPLQAPALATPPPPTPRPVEPPTVPSVEQTAKRLIERTTERTKVRHSFDVFADQLLALRQLALTRETATGTRVLLGDLVQEAIDLLIERGSGGN